MTHFEDLSITTRVVLFSIVGSLVGIVITVAFAFLRAVKNVLYKHRRGRQGQRAKVSDSATTAEAHEPDAQPQRQSAMSYKQLMQKTKQAKNKKQTEGKVLDHPLYIFSLKDHREGVNGFSWAFDGSAVVSACEDRCVRLFTFSESIDKGVLTRQINIHGIPVDVGFLNDTDNIVVLSKGFLDTASLLFYTNQPLELGGAHWTCTRTIEKAFGTDCPLRLETVINPETSKLLIIACSATKEAKIYDKDGALLSSFTPNSFANHDLAVSYNARLASIATFTADAKVWDIKFSRSGAFDRSSKVMDLRGHKSQVMTVAFSMDATKAVSVSKDGIMKIWNVDVQYNLREDPKCIVSVQPPLNEKDHYRRLAFGPDNALAAAVKDSIHFIDIKNGEVIDRIDGAHDGLITSICWAPKKLMCKKGSLRVLASSSKDQRVRLWAHPEDI